MHSTKNIKFVIASYPELAQSHCQPCRQSFP